MWHWNLRLWNTDAPGGKKKSKCDKNSKSHILTSTHPQRQVISGKCEQPWDELTVQVWLLYLLTNTLYVKGMDKQKDR